MGPVSASLRHSPTAQRVATCAGWRGRQSSCVDLFGLVYSQLRGFAHISPARGDAVRVLILTAQEKVILACPAFEQLRDGSPFLEYALQLEHFALKCSDLFRDDDEVGVVAVGSRGGSFSQMSPRRTSSSSGRTYSNTLLCSPPSMILDAFSSSPLKRRKSGIWMSPSARLLGRFCFRTTRWRIRSQSAWSQTSTGVAERRRHHNSRA